MFTRDFKSLGATNGYRKLTQTVCFIVTYFTAESQGGTFWYYYPFMGFS